MPDAPWTPVRGRRAVSERTTGRDGDKGRDAVNHPEHYNKHPSGVECIDVIEHMDWLPGTIIKYLWRYPETNSLADLKKARWYIDRMVEKHRAP